MVHTGNFSARECASEPLEGMCPQDKFMSGGRRLLQADKISDFIISQDVGKGIAYECEFGKLMDSFLVPDAMPQQST